MKCGITHKKVEKMFFSVGRNWFKIGLESSLAPNLRPKIFLWSNLKNLWFYPGRKEKYQNFLKNGKKKQKFLNFKCGFPVDYAR